MTGRRQAFQNNPEFQRFVLPGVRSTGRQLGVGSYGSVEELEMNGLVCAGKRLHEALLEQGNAGVANIARKYFLECQVMAEMRHPHIVQFLGLCFLEGSALPMLVMERLDRSLDNLLETSPGLPLAFKQLLLADVARGLLYLHTHNPPIVHRDLSARNVLLTSSLVAKISDLGNARIVNLQSGQRAWTLSCVPGTLSYMPPEAFDEGSQYGPRLDIFSFGHLALFTLTQVFPGNLLPHNYPDPDNPGRLIGRSEVERRTDYIKPLYQELGEQHPLVQLVHHCLHNIPAQRPSAEELLQQLEAQMEEAYGKKLVRAEMARLQVAMMAMLRTEETDSREKDIEIKHLQRDLQRVQEDRERLQAEVEAKDAEIDRQQQQLQTLIEEKGRLQAEVEGQVQEKVAEIKRLQRELQTLREDRGSLRAEMEAKDAEIDSQYGELQTLTEEKGRLQTEVEAGLGQVQEKDVEIKRLQRELQTLREDRERLKAEVEAKDAEIDSQHGQLQTLTEEKGRLQTEVEAGLGQVQEKDAEIKRLQREFQTLREDRGSLKAEVEAKDAEIDSQYGQLQTLTEEKGRLQTEVKAGLGQVQEKDAKIKRLQRELEGYKSGQECVEDQMVMEMDDKKRTMGRLRAGKKKFKAGIMRKQRSKEEMKIKGDVDTTIAQFQRQLHERDGEIIRLERELQTLRAEMDAKIQQLQERDGEINKLPTEQRDQTPSRYEHVNIKQSPTQEPLLPLQQQWYFGQIKRADAGKLLHKSGHPTGTFLIRDSESQPGNYALSVRYGICVKHYFIKKTDTGGYYIDIVPRRTFNSLDEIVWHYSREADGLCYHLTVPCSNFKTPSTTGLLYDTKGVREIERSSIELKKQLGTGQFGEVWEGIWNGAPVAVKTLKTEIVEMKDFLAELQLVTKLRHEKLIQLYGVCTVGESLYIVTELMKNGSLLDYLRVGEGQHLQFPNLINIAAQVASGMAYLEEQNYIHQKLGARNVLIGEGHIFKIADLGLAHVITDDEDTTRILPIKWTAPEAALFNRFSIKSDVWSYGIFLFELITHGQAPYPEMTELNVLEKVAQGYRIPPPPSCPDPLYQIMMDCWKENPEERPTFEYLKHHMEDYFVATEQTHLLK